MGQYIGTVSGWLTLIVVAALAWTMVRGGSGTAVSGLQDVNRELERQVHSRDATIIEKDRLITELRAQKDVTTAILPVLEAMHNHERRAEERHVKNMVLMDLIAARLGKFNGDE